MKKGDWLLTGILLAALPGFGCSEEAETSAAARPEARRPPRPSAAAPPAIDAESLEILSVLSVERQVELLAQREGVVVEISADQGSRVKKGDVLARMDDRELRAQLERAQADLAMAESQVKYNEAEVKAKQAAYRRAQQMNELGLNSEADLEEAEFKARGAEYDLQGWRLLVERNRADIRLLELELEKTSIRAPFGGVVAQRYIRLGQNVLKDDKCFRLSQLAPLQVRFLVPETAGRRPRRGEPVNVVPVSDSQRVYTARIQRVSPTVDAASGSYDITAQLTDPDVSELRPGMSVRVLWRAEAPDAKP
ncbi:MAG: efflux RND transporter periplasmic adaptor subunit [Terriglobia bacterium]